MATQKEEIVVKAGFDNTSLARGLRTAEGMVAEFATRISILFAVGALVGFDKTLVSWAKNLSETAERLGTTTDEVQRLNFVADQTGVSIEKVAGALDRLAKSKEQGLGHVGSGTPEEMALSQKAFAQFGLTLSDIQRDSPIELFNAISASIEKTGVNSQVTANAMALMGRNAGQLIPMMKEMKNLSPQADILPAGAVRDLEAQGRFMDKMWTRFKVMAGTLISPSSWHQLTGAGQAELRAERDAKIADRMHQGEIDWLNKTQAQWHEIHDIKVDELHNAKELGKQEDEMLKTRQKYLDKVVQTDEIQKRMAASNREIGAVNRQISGIDKFIPTLEELAGNRYTQHLARLYGSGGRFNIADGQGPLAQAARDAELAKYQQMWDATHGNYGQAELDRQRQIKAENLLGAAGFDTPAMKQEEMKRHLADISQNIHDLLKKADAEGVPVKVNIP